MTSRVPSFTDATLPVYAHRRHVHRLIQVIASASTTPRYRGIPTFVLLRKRKAFLAPVAIIEAFQHVRNINMFRIIKVVMHRRTKNQPAARGLLPTPWVFGDDDRVLKLVAHLLNSRSEIPFVWMPPEYGEGGETDANAEFAKFLRALVDRWIDSGIDSFGRERPLRRHLQNRLSGFNESLFDLLLRWTETHLKPALLGTGKVTFLDQFPFLPKPDPESLGRDRATYWFMELLNCPGANRLARCSNIECGAYYVRQRLRKKEIKRGPFCERCAGTAATDRVKLSRERQKQALINLAADVWPTTWKPTKRYSTLSMSVVAAMKKKAKTPVAITGKWVTQNRKAIEIEVERRENAKS
jgi:hypothetical protein